MVYMVFISFFLFLLAHAYQMEPFLSFFTGVWLVPPGLRILVFLLVPLVEIEVVAHLPDCFSCWGLVLDWDFGHACVYVEFDVISIENVLVLVIYLDVLVALDAMVVVTGYSLLFGLLNLI